jgi:hypothetical protein
LPGLTFFSDMFLELNGCLVEGVLSGLIH